MEFSKKHTATSEEFGKELWMLCKKYSKGFYEQFKPQVEEAGFSLSKEQQTEFFWEIWIANLWIISKVLSLDKKALDKLHEIAILGPEYSGSQEERRELIQSFRDDVNERYEIYDNAWKDVSGDKTLLAIAILEQMLNRGQPDRRFLNILLTLFVNTHVVAMMESVSEFRKEFEILD